MQIQLTVDRSREIPVGPGIEGLTAGRSFVNLSDHAS
jgi:hypothetical protein